MRSDIVFKFCEEFTVHQCMSTVESIGPLCGKPSFHDYLLDLRTTSGHCYARQGVHDGLGYEHLRQLGQDATD